LKSFKNSLTLNTVAPLCRYAVQAKHQGGEHGGFGRSKARAAGNSVYVLVVKQPPRWQDQADGALSVAA
jgi:hypothetical protein